MDNGASKAKQSRVRQKTAKKLSTAINVRVDEESNSFTDVVHIDGKIFTKRSDKQEFSNYYCEFYRGKETTNKCKASIKISLTDNENQCFIIKKHYSECDKIVKLPEDDGSTTKKECEKYLISEIESHI